MKEKIEEEIKEEIEAVRSGIARIKSSLNNLEYALSKENYALAEVIAGGIELKAIWLEKSIETLKNWKKKQDKEHAEED